MNIHPLIVHFPIALLSLYALFELIRFRNQTWFHIKSILVILGTLGAYAAAFVGDDARHLLLQSHPDLRSLVSHHEFWAQSTIAIFTILAAAYLAAWLEGTAITRWPIVKQLWPLVRWLRRVILYAPVAIILALAGLACLTITGALGGSIVYGAANDPFTNWIYNIIKP